MKISREVLTQIKALAKKMPPSYTGIPVYRVVSGAQILEANPDAKTKFGHKIDPSERYTIKVSDDAPVNQLKQMKKIFLKEGMPGLNKYVRYTIDINTPKTIGGIQTAAL